VGDRRRRPLDDGEAIEGRVRGDLTAGGRISDARDRVDDLLSSLIDGYLDPELRSRRNR
jgi:hypothetical protein